MTAIGESEVLTIRQNVAVIPASCQAMCEARSDSVSNIDVRHTH